MVTQELKDFVIRELNNGRDEEAIKNQLSEANWSFEDIDTVFRQIHFPTQNSSGIQINHLLPPSALLNSSWNIYKKTWKSLVKILFFSTLLYLPLIILFPLAGLSLGINMFAMTITGIVSVVLLSVYAAAVQAIQYISLISFIASGEEKVYVKTLFIESLAKAKAYWWLSFLQMVILFSGVMFFFIPGIIYFVWFSFSQNILILEKIGGLKAMLISREIVRGRFWGILLRMGVMLAIFFVASFVLSYVPKIMMFIADPSSLSLTQPVNPDPSNILGIAGIKIILNFIFGFLNMIVVFPLFLIYNLILYKNVKQLYGKPLNQISEKSKIMLFLPAILLFIFLIGFLGIMVYRVIVVDPKGFSR